MHLLHHGSMRMMQLKHMHTVAVGGAHKASIMVHGTKVELREEGVTRTCVNVKLAGCLLLLLTFQN